ncbi:hypothetical protein EVG20_g3278 [Dentipellis fragilis]|uniref:U3 small nucleolar RNA-associated protein 25 n=1 Tax=Dentipellis fragilis TaxID=205917 RepID=A0A4Y9Z3J9_9AGAM|nr:hypothetical protein EVG20_g3278 [Dentipellis fragilis]
MDTGNSPTTQLLTLLNVSAAKSTKRKRALGEQSPPSKLNKRRPVFAGVQDVHSSRTSSEEDELPTVKEAETDKGVESDQASEIGDVDVGADAEDETQDPYEQHFGINSSTINSTAKEAVDSKSWTTAVSTKRKLGSVAVSVPSGSSSPSSLANGSASISERLKEPFQELQAKLKPDQRDFQNDLLSIVSTYEDLYHTHQSLDAARVTREAIALHALNHVTKKRRRVLKNNERISHATKAGNPAPENIQDQGFTRPSVLIVLPFRSCALNWFDALTEHTPSPSYQIENRARFRREFGLPEGVVDKLAVAEPGTYPRDHVETFKGNVDDNFRVGIKLTRKSVKLFSNFYGSDIILASPLGLRMSIEKENNADFLSSIEILVVDQMDALTMQNWEHFVMSHLNQLPKESHDTDFSRVKPWYLDGNAPYLRQSILFSAYETPEMRSLYNQTLKNVAGKVRTIRTWAPVQVPADLEQNFISFDCSSLKDEPDKRFNYFTTQVLPAVMKSAVQSENTAIFIPSSFDFIRIQNYFKRQGYSYTVLSEYSSNQDISRARQALFNGKKSFLLISERFHFYRRYKIRGIRNLIFYGPPDHPQFYTELLSFPFLDEGVETSDVTCRVLYSRYDWFKMERIAGTKGASQLIKQNSM